MYYNYHIFCCNNQRPDEHPRGCCGAERGKKIREAFAKALAEHGVKDARSNLAGCFNRCEDAPVVVIYPEGVWYQIENIERDVPQIVKEHVIGGQIVERLRLPDRPGELR